MAHRFILLFLVLFNWGYAQNISGLWITQDLDGEQANGYTAVIYLKMDNKNKVTGYIYDEEDGGWCHYKLEGRYNPRTELLRLNTTDLIEKTEDHDGVKFTLNYEIAEGHDYFTGKLKLKGFRPLLKAAGIEVVKDVRLKRTTAKAIEQHIGYLKMEPYLSLSDRNMIWDHFLKTEEMPIVKSDTIVNSDNRLSIETTENTLNPNPQSKDLEANAKTDEMDAFSKAKNNRKNELVTVHEVTSSRITIEILDTSRQDGDRISIYLNNRLLRYNLEVTKEPKRIDLELTGDKKIHKLLFVANNVGRIPPNTAKIRYTIDGISYEQVLFTNLELNKYLQFVIK